MAEPAYYPFDRGMRIRSALLATSILALGGFAAWFSAAASSRNVDLRTENVMSIEDMMDLEVFRWRTRNAATCAATAECTEEIEAALAAEAAIPPDNFDVHSPGYFNASVYEGAILLTRDNCQPHSLSGTLGISIWAVREIGVKLEAEQHLRELRGTCYFILSFPTYNTTRIAFTFVSGDVLQWSLDARLDEVSADGQ